MRKKLLLVVGLFISMSVAKAQVSVLLYEDFNDTIIGTNVNQFIDLNYPNAVVGDTMWYSYDEDALPDGSGGGRPDNWFMQGGGWWYPDTLDICLASNSWTNDAVNEVKNWFILPAIQITDGASAWLKWVAAPRQTPRYCDGYEIRVSTTNNDLISFTDVIYTAAEFQSGAASGNAYSGGTYDNYVFSSGFQHGADGLYIDCTGCVDLVDSSRWYGIQRPDSVSLAAYDNQMIYIAFYHNTIDDNLIAIDDIEVSEISDPTFSIDQLPEFAGSVYPNPATDFVNVNFDIAQYHNASCQLINSSGQVMYSSLLTTQNHRIDLQNIASGVYFVKIMADEGNMVRKLVVRK